MVTSAPSIGGVRDPETVIFPPCELVEMVRLLDCFGLFSTFKVMVIEWVLPPPDAYTVTVKLPIGVDSVVAMVNVEVKMGLPEAGLKLGDAPLGKPVAVKDTD